MAGARLRDIASGRRDALNIDPRDIKIEPLFNPRRYDLFENRQHLEDLKRSISQLGVLQPLIVRWDGEQAIVVDGECRLRACLELIKEGIAIKTVPVLQETTNNEAQRLLTAIAANKGKPLTLLEAGGAYKRLQAFGWDLLEIATKVGVSKSVVSDAIELFDSPRDVKEMVSKGEVTPSLAKQVVRQKGDKAGAALKEKVTQAKAAGKKTAKREAQPSPAKVALKASFDTLITLGDELVDQIIDNEDLVDSTEFRLARKWNKLRGR